MLPSRFDDRAICIIGLGYVGLTLAVVLAEAGFKVFGVETNTDIVAKISEGRAHFMEQGLEPRLARQVLEGRLTASDEWPTADQVSVYLVTVGTPLSTGGTVNLDSMSKVAGRIAQQIKAGDLVILRSTVKVGVSRAVVMPILDKAEVQYDIAFCPERTVEGRALEELRTLPQIVGGDTAESAVRASQIFSIITPTVIRVADLETAEMIKLLNNTQRDLLFAFANEIASICDDVGVSAKEVIQAGNMGYARAFMPLPGPVGGPCLEKDPYILAESTSSPQTIAKLSLLGRQINEQLPQEVINQINSLLNGQEILKIAILGLAFKGRPETSDLRGTLAIKLIADLKAHYPNAVISGFDPAVPPSEVASLQILPGSDAYASAQDANVVIFQNNNLDFQKLDMSGLFKSMSNGGLVYDLWNQFDTAALVGQNGVRYVAFGSKNQIVE